MKCRICGCDQVESQIYVREMMIPTREKFEYFECRNCHCLQIKDIPGNLESYYGEGYYSFREPEILHQENITDMSSLNMTPVLDVGCGSGKFLKKLYEQGYGNLKGCDPFIAHDIEYDEGIRIYKKTIHEMDGHFDMIFMNDSFEHVTDPHEVMDSVLRLLAPSGIARISIPVYPNIAYDMFGTNWYQIDAPRHIFLHSIKSMEILAKAHGLKIIDVLYDSDPSQIFRSYLYAEDIPFWDQKMSMFIDRLGRHEADEIVNLTSEANEKGYGDHAVFSVMCDDR